MKSIRQHGPISVAVEQVNTAIPRILRDGQAGRGRNLDTSHDVVCLAGWCGSALNLYSLEDFGTSDLTRRLHVTNAA